MLSQTEKLTLILRHFNALLYWGGRARKIERKEKEEKKCTKNLSYIFCVSERPKCVFIIMLLILIGGELTTKVKSDSS
jgi:hypothetical protein